jgi:hypothetical protein
MTEITDGKSFTKNYFRMVAAVKKEIIKLIEKKGPLRGSEIQGVIGEDSIRIWKSCILSKELTLRRLGKRYLRLDRNVEGFARLSPSILREFLTYSVVGLADEPNSLEQRAQEIICTIKEISRSKFELARNFVSDIISRFESEGILDYEFCFILAGDIVYNMAHDVPRPERSTGKMVKGSDIDLIVIMEDRTPDVIMKKLDDAIYQGKYRLLIAPSINEEIDYIVKKMGRVHEQVSFSNFRHMVACKIIHEGVLLYGSEKMFRRIKMLLHEKGVTDKLHTMNLQAEDFRKQAEKYLLGEIVDNTNKKNLYLFYTSEESEEFE